MESLSAQMGLELGCSSARLLRMIDNIGGYHTAVAIIRREDPTVRFLSLHRHGGLALSVEAWILQPQWQHLFPQSTKIVAYERLRHHGFIPPSDYWNPSHLFKHLKDGAPLAVA